MKSLLSLTTELELICEEIEQTEGDITNEMLEKFNNAKLAHAEKIDNWCHVFRTIAHNSAFYSERSKTLARRAKTLEKLEASLKEYVKHIVKSSEAELPWKGTEGDYLRVQKSPESLKLDVMLDKRSFSNIILGENLAPYKNFIEVCTLYLLNKESVKSYLKGGNYLDWAKLDQGEHLRVGK